MPDSIRTGDKAEIKVTLIVQGRHLAELKNDGQSLSASF